jgi:hypothetical protein
MSQAVKSYEVQVVHLKAKNTELDEKSESLSESCDSMQKEIKRLLTDNIQLEKKVLILQKDQEIEDRVKTERLTMEKTKERENAETKFKHETEKVSELYKYKEDKWHIELQKANQEIQILKDETQKEKGCSLNSVISLEKQVAQLSKELELTKIENFDMKSIVKELEKELSLQKHAPVQYMNLTDDEEDMVIVLKLNQRLEKQIKLKTEEVEELNATYKSLLNNEKQKLIANKEKVIDFRERFDEKKNQFMHEILEKDEQIVKLTKQLRDIKKTTNPGMAEARSSSKFGRTSDMSNLSTTEYTLLRMCQNMVDTARRME